MEPVNLFDEGQENRGKRISLNAGLSLELLGGQGKKPSRAILYRQGVFVKDVDLKDRVAKRLFIVDVVDLGASKSYLAAALGISRQTIDNHLEIRKHFGKEGLIQGYNPAESKDRRKQRKLHKEDLNTGNKARNVAEIRAKEREKSLSQQKSITFTFSGGAGKFDEIEKDDLPFAEEHDWEKTRYAGTFLYLIPLINQWDWLRLILDYFRHQIRSGLVGISIWFTDGHLLPYSGKHRVHSAYNTQRRMLVPGRAGMVTCDGSGRIVDFEIQEGKGDLRSHIAALGKKWREDMPHSPVQVFDREGHGADFFAGLVNDKIPFVTWEKHVDTKKLEAMEDSQFTTEFELNGKSYGVFEGEKILVDDKNDSDEQKKVTLRRIYLWNKTSNRRTCGLAWTTDAAMTTEECARAILCRWGASENTFKHLKDHHPWHYHPGFQLVKSERQDIANPEIKEKETLIGVIRKGLDKLYRKLSKAKEAVKADGVPRQNSIRERLQQSIAEDETKLLKLNEEKKQLPPRVDVSTLEDYKSFNRIDNEGKYLFDFVTISIWNARKQMIDWLSPHFNAKDELVDLFYAITNCHGWLKSTTTEVTVRLEPLQQPRNRLAQEQLCRKLTSLQARTPNGKRLMVEAGEAPV